MSAHPFPDGICRRINGRQRALSAAAVLLCLLLLAPVSSDRILTFSTRTGSIAGVETAEVWVDGLVVMRLRAPDGAETITRKAGIVASRLRDLALEGLLPDALKVEKVAGEWSVTGAGRLIVTADADTAKASGMQPADLCESWRKRIAEVLREPYLVVQPHETMLVPVGETRVLRVGGSVQARPTVETLAGHVVEARQDGPGRWLLKGLGTGTTVASIKAGPLRHAISVEVKRWAARIPATASVPVIGEALEEPMASVAALNAALVNTRAEPEAFLQLVSASPTQSGFRVGLRAGGPDFIPTSGTVAVSFRRGLTPIPPATTLMVSNYPERVTGVGALLRQALKPGRPARLMWHHKNYAGYPLVLAVRLVNAGAGPASVRLGWSEAGPDHDEIFVGFNAMMRYWQAIRAGAGFEARIPPGASFETAAVPMSREDVVSGLMDLIVDEGDDLFVEVAARIPQDVPSGFGAAPRGPDEMPVTPYEFPASIEEHLTYEVGGRFGHLSIGREEIVNDAGFALEGAYGIMHEVTIDLSNPCPERGRVEIAVRAGGGVARALAMVDGELHATHLLRATQQEVLTTRDLAPGQKRQMRIRLMPTAGSNLPLTLVVRGRTV